MTKPTTIALVILAGATLNIGMAHLINALLPGESLMTKALCVMTIGVAVGGSLGRVMVYWIGRMVKG